MEYVYSTAPLVASYQYNDLTSLAPVLLIGFMCAIFAAVVAGACELEQRYLYPAVLTCFCVFPMYWVYKAQSTVPLPNIPVVGTIDSWLESTELVRVNKHRTEPQLRGYMVYRVEDVMYPVKIEDGKALPARAIFYKNPRQLVGNQ